MPWPFSESIKKRACRYLLHRYLGHFLQEKLSLDQLSLDLYQGTGSLAQVPLDKWSLNEILESVDAPFEVIEGFIQTICLSVPWASLLQENCALEVKGLKMVFRPRPRMASDSEPMCWSSFMASSMQLAKECLSQKLTDEQGEGLQPLEGLEKFAETIETVLRRVKVTFLDTVLRIEHIPENSKTGIALEMRISRVEYFDETGDECSGVNVHQPTMFAHKTLKLSGFTVFWDEFSEAARTCPKFSSTQPEIEPKLSPSWNPKIICEPHPQFTRTESEAAPFEPVQIGYLSGTVDLSLTLKQNEAYPGAKLDVNGQVDSVNMLMSPRQVHLVLDMLGVFSGSEHSVKGTQSCKDRKSRPIQQEDEYRLHMELNRYLKKDLLSVGGLGEQDFFENEATRHTSSREEEVFFSMAEMDMSHSLSSLPPLGDPPTDDLDLSLNSQYTASPTGSPSGNAATVWDDYLEPPRHRETVVQEPGFLHKETKPHPKLLRQTSSKSNSSDESRPDVVFRLAVSSFSVLVLHIDPLPPPETSLSQNPLPIMAAGFFSCIEKINTSEFTKGNFKNLRPVFDKACPHDHLRFIGTSLKMMYEQRQGPNFRVYNTDMSIGNMELLECLFPTDSLSCAPQYTELVRFDSGHMKESSSTCCLHLNYKFSERRGPQGSQGRLSSMPQKAEFNIELDSVYSELDISIVDRLNSLLQPQKLATTEMMASHMYTSYNKNVSLHKAFTEVFLDDSRSPSNCRVSFLVNMPILNLAVRFPIPDLRSDQERGPWFKKSLQKEILYLEFRDVEFKTEFTVGFSQEQMKLELTFREMIGSFQDNSYYADAIQKFLRVSRGVDGEMTTSDSGKFDWPRIELKVNPMAVHSILERVATGEEETEGHSPEEEEGTAHSLKDVCDFAKPEPSPFSSRRVMYENEEMVIPGDVHEMNEFQDKTISSSRYVLELCLPNVELSLPNKAFYEKLHNRINNDLLLWEPTAPSPVETFENISYGVGLSVASQLINTYSKDSFSQFRSVMPDEDESGSEEETMQYYTTGDPGFRNRRKRKLEPQNKTSQSLLSVLLNVNHGLVTLQTDAKQEDGKRIEGKHGEFWLEIDSGVLFSVSQYEGYEDQQYICLHTNRLCLYHQGLVDDTVPKGEIKMPSKTRPHWLEPTIYRSEEGLISKQNASDPVAVENQNMLSVAIKIHSENLERNLKEYIVSVGVRGATLQHCIVPSSLSWHEQILDFLNVSDEPVLGYNPPASGTTFHLHLWSCSLDYRPRSLPIRSLLTVETFSISRNISLDKSSSTLRIILDEAALFLSDKCNAVSVNLSRDYVQVVDMGLLELRISATKPGKNGERTEPRFEMRCSSDVIHIRTCADSCAALMNLIQYIASYGDLAPPSELETNVCHTKRGRLDILSQPPSQPSPLPEAEQQMLQDLMSEAMEDTDIQQMLPSDGPHTNGSHDVLAQTVEPARSDLFLFPDESGTSSREPSPTHIPFHQPMIFTAVPESAPESDDFCILETPLSGVNDRDEEPLVKKLTMDSIEIKENHFCPVDRADSNKVPMRFPVPEIRYLVKEISLIWHLYGGRDFGSGQITSSPAKSHICTPHSSPSQTPVRQGRTSARIGGGRGRKLDVLMEIQLSKVKFQHEVYPESGTDCEFGVGERPVSRQMFIVQDLEIRDRLASSQMNKFLYLYSSKELPRKAHSNMLTVKALHVCPESGRAPQECCLRVSLMPLRLNIDQDALFFLKEFFSSLAAEVELLAPPEQEAKKPPAPDLSCSFPKHGSSSLDPAPIISVPGQSRQSMNGMTLSSSTEHGEADTSSSGASFTDQPVFFREFRFTSEVPIRLDYHGKHMAMEQGTFAGIVIGLTQLNCSELKLKRLCCRQGLLGVDKLFAYAIGEWLNDIKKNQLPGILGGVGPIHSLVQLVQGVKDLVWLPIEQYRKDGRIVRGFQRGASSFGTSTAMAALELTNRMVQTIQAAAETAYDMVSPGPDDSELKRIKRLSHYRLTHQPVDLREGVAKAYTVVKEGITDTALTIYDTATREHEQRGVTGAVGGVLRQIPPAVVKPLIVATEATSNVLGGMRNQIRPDARQEESQKWRLGED
ncbi:autophagy-related protein 2 homolog B-like isoform X1 [Polypterus senegalus]|uniref:autophagy-related protein 2 homolog B-like isoform X1 n=1 Tax=Polypterus senegalus TaxID=55291 RepID=UPI0019623950|nr:autophagy-related protein 2 homolog B-like isoform X1 [Polypterus senegalus]